MRKSILIFSVFLSFLMIEQVKAQEKAISGTVTSKGQTSVPLPGVNVIVKGTSKGVQTDFDGRYEINASVGEVLEFSYVGLAPVAVTVGTLDIIDVSMEENLEQLEDVVVTAYGIKREAKKLGYSIQTVQGEDVSNVKTVNVTNALSGRATGVQINQNGTGVAGSSSIVIRGIASLSPDNQPLIVIDGVIVDNGGLGQGGFDGGIDYGNALSDINAEDIASINILKGGNATALYGYRGANGVVLITTKNGNTGKVQVDFSTSITLDDILVAPKFQNEYGQGRFDTGANELVYDTSVGTSWGPRLDGSQRERFDGVGTAAYSADDNDFKDYYRLGYTIINSVAVAQGLEKANYRFSYSYLDNESILPGSGYDRHNFSLKAGLDISKRLKLTGKIDYIRSNAENRPDLTDGQANSVKNLAFRPRNISNALLRNNFINEDGAPNNWNGAFIQNPYYAALTKLNTDKKDRYLGLLKLDYNITDELLASLRISQDQSNANALVFQPDGAFNVRPNGGMIDLTSTTTINNYDFLLNFDKNEIISNVSLGLTAGLSQATDFFKLTRATGENILVPGLFAIDNFSNKNVTTDIAETKSNSVFGSFSLGYKNYAFLEVTGRNDWSSTLPIDNASFFYPSVGASFVATDAFNTNSKILSYLKLRASYAKVGNATEPYRLRNTYNISSNTYNGQSFFFFGANIPSAEEGAAPGIDLSNPDLEAELSTTYEFGIDARLFGNRMTLDATYYNNETENQILDLTLPPSYGAESRIINAGLVKNFGVEISLNAIPIESEKFSWNTSVNFSKNESEVVELAERVPTQVLARQFNDVVQLVASEGKPYGDLVGSTYERDEQGRIVYDTDGLPIVGDLGVIGNVTPDFLLGWQNTFKYKNLTLGVLLDSRFGGDIFSFSDISLATNGTDERTLQGREFFTGGQGILVPDNAVVDGTLPVEIQQRGVNPEAYWTRLGTISEAWVYDATFVKLREVSLTYNLNSSWLKGIGVKTLSLSYIGRNLAVLYKDTPNFDPENGFNTSFSGIEFFGFPSTTSHGFKMNVSF
ncbi:SusC/RagA family TonB-linked outer membrane protein [Aquimarina sp. MMG016]|uniref:SusC/RagA family TonB-linked outer membrane protein n=1 Tax=Aquimarina sp. MMG016 TaxID=2822690 RepID=UPI001B3A5888|nr:SusC/RagA family TonB-linked outer membrane protein [Aquimarina sp. MMG016]MBQ4822723.1 SusC/RagA family TonB-linked outer membrane protein [Aquimarina sp. MMG016]